MDIIQVNHVGIVVEDLDKALRGFVDLLGLPVTRRERYGDQIDIAFLPSGETLVELLEPLGTGFTQEWLDTHGPGVQHIAFEVTDIRAAMAELAAKGVGFLFGDEPVPGAGGMLITFLEPGLFGGALVELCQPDPDADTATAVRT